jgi:threonine/homoserine/homoserine lactone efflux protein
MINLILTILFEGVLTGLLLAVLVGPVFFNLLQTSIVHGFKMSFSFALGIFLSDILLLLLCQWGWNTILIQTHYQYYIGLLGSGILICIGAINLLKKPMPTPIEATHGTFNWSMFFIKGFIVNTLNPAVILFWIATLSVANSHYKNQPSLTLVFFTGVLFTTFSTDMIKALLAYKLRRFLDDKTISILNKSAGILIIISGIIGCFKTIG